MTREEIISGLKFTVEMFLYEPSTGKTITEPRNDMDKTTIDACRGAIELLEHESKDIVKAFQFGLAFGFGKKYNEMDKVIDEIKKVITPQSKIGHCKECKYFEYDSVANIDGIPLIVAHELCSRWGDGCKTKEDGYCFLFEPKEGEDK